MPTKRVAGPGKYAPGCRSDRARLGGTGLPEKGETKGRRQRSTGTSEAWVGWMTGGLDETGRRQSAPKWSASRVQAEAPTPPAPHPPVEKKALPVGWLVVTMMIFLGKMGRAGHEWREHAITGRAGGGGGGPGIGPHGNSYPLPPRLSVTRLAAPLLTRWSSRSYSSSTSAVSRSLVITWRRSAAVNAGGRRLRPVEIPVSSRRWKGGIHPEGGGREAGGVGAWPGTEEGLSLPRVPLKRLACSLIPMPREYHRNDTTGGDGPRPVEPLSYRFRRGK